MMKTTYLTYFVSAMFIFTAYTAQAQCDAWNWPEDKQTATEKNVLYDDYMKNGQYDKSVAPLTWLLQNAPDLNKSLYINGEKIFDNLTSAEKNPERKKVYLDSLMIIFDMRIKFCNDEGTVLNRRAYAEYKYNKDDKSKLKQTLDFFEKHFKVNGTNVADAHLVAYMDIIRRNKIYLKNLTDEEVIARYDIIMDIADKKIKEKGGRGVEAIQNHKNTIDDILITIVDVNCDFVKTNMEPKFKENPSDIALAKKIFKFMLSGKCTDDPLWMKTGEVIGANEPDYGLFKNLGLKALSGGDVSKAEAMFKKALEHTETPADKADMYINLGDIDAKRGNKAAARENFRKALNADPNRSEAWDKIGFLYYGSFEDCAEQKSMAFDRAVYLAAYEMFQKAGNTRMMNSAKEQFPSITEIFEQNIERGSEMKVGCWINETVKVQTRD